MVWFEVSLVVVVILFVLLVAFIVKKALVLAVNSIIGFFALYITWFFVPIKINLWSVLLVAIGGIMGYLLVLVLHLLGIAF